MTYFLQEAENQPQAIQADRCSYTNSYSGMDNMDIDFNLADMLKDRIEKPNKITLF